MLTYQFGDFMKLVINFDFFNAVLNVNEEINCLKVGDAKCVIIMRGNLFRILFPSINFTFFGNFYRQKIFNRPRR